QFITTTELREQSSKLIRSLLSGKSVNLIYRSKIIAKINPISFSEKIINDSKKLENFFTFVKPKKIIPKQKRKEIYKKHLKQKYGKDLS
ncbi:MAG: hypothetical protein NZM02_01675, partial [Patescibacteria group bacterium]|nr:hypothetical protein [Patescibacteria group bacterium]